MAKKVLLISCSDEPGLVHKITGVLYRRGLNIIENSEFADPKASSFDMRTEFDDGLSHDQRLPETELEAELCAVLPPKAEVRLGDLGRKKRIVLLATREPHCLGDLLLRHSYGELHAEIQAVISQYDTLRGLTERFGIPFYQVPVIDPQPAARQAHEDKLRDALAPFHPDYLVLAKYMRILSPSFIQDYANRILNIHHSFLPAFVGSQPYAQAYERGVKIIGATSHFVTEELDQGPIITQAVIPINHTQDAGDLAKSGRDVERIVLARALDLVLQERVIVRGRRTLVFE